MSDDPTEPDPTELPSTEAAQRPSNDQKQIGPYRLLQKLGEGGMGEVWLAEQSEPVKRRVALKIIKQGMDTKQVVARFEAERQALAMMDHPAVAKVFDAGTTPHGRPYFVMEYVNGVPITEHCDRHKLTNRERLDLFMQVCEGVQHAHQKAIIHRDLKPSNVMVTEQGGKRLPKIIDFGVAKATAQKLTEKTVYTELGVLIGTPEYMSPEQAELTGEDVDTRTDVYSLGVMLYELLVGALPFDSKELRSGGYEGIRKKIREEEPHKPSTRLSTLGDRSTESAKCRRVDLPTLRRQLRGDLDWITMRALEKDRSRRYGSPNELAAEIHRHLRHEPVEAGPPSTIYRTRKFVRRHRLGVTLAIAAVLLVLGFAVRERIQSSRIAREREASDRVSEFLADMLSDLDPHLLGSALWDDLRVRVAEVRRGQGASEDDIEAVLAELGEMLSGVNATDTALALVEGQILAPAGETIGNEFENHPRIAGRLEYTLSETYRGLGRLEAAERHARRAVEKLHDVLGEDHPDTLTAVYRLAGIVGLQGRNDEAEMLFRGVFENARRVLGPEHPGTLWSMNGLANAYRSLGRYDEAERYFRQVLEVQRRELGNRHLLTAVSMNDLGIVHSLQGRYDEAENLFRQAIDIRQRALGREHRLTLKPMNNLAETLSRAGRYGEAESLLRETIEVKLRVLGREHMETLSSMANLASLLRNEGRYGEAETLQRETLGILRQSLGPEHPHTLESLHNLAFVCYRQGRYPEAERFYVETIKIRKRLLGDEHRDTLWSMNNLALLYMDQGSYHKAEPLYLETLEVQKRVLGDDHPDTLASMNNLANLYRIHGRYAEADLLYLETLEIRKRVLGDDHPDTLDSMNNLAASLGKSQGRYDEARPLVIGYMELQKRRAETSSDARASNSYAWMALTCEPADLRDPRAALELALVANEQTNYEVPMYLDTLALAYHLTGDTTKAIETQRRALLLLPADSPRRAVYENSLSGFEAALGQGE